MIQVSDVVNAPEFAQDFTIERSSGVWQNGKWISSTSIVNAYGTIEVATPRDVEMIPEGDKIVGAMKFYSECPIFGTHAEPAPGGSSDILVWRGERFRVLQDSEWVDYGYFRAIAVRLKSA